PKSRKRSAVIELIALGNKPVRLNARASTRLQQSVSSEYLIVPGTPTKVTVTLGSTDTAAFDGGVQFYLDNGYLKTARVVAEAVPGELAIEIPEAISNKVMNFGAIPMRSKAERPIIIRNLGGTPVPLELEIPDPFVLVTDPGPQLGPLASMRVLIGLNTNTDQQGGVDATMNVMGPTQVLPIRLLANLVVGDAGMSQSSPVIATRPASVARTPGAQAASVSPAAARPRTDGPPTFRFGSKQTSVSPTPPSDPVPERRIEPIAPEPGPTITATDSPPPLEPADPQSEADGIGNQGAAGPIRPWYSELKPDELEASRSPLGFPTRDLFEREINPNLRSPEDLILETAESDELNLSWTAPRNSELSTFQVEVRASRVDIENGIHDSVWIPYPHVEIERIDRLIKAQLEQLTPVTTYELRVIMIDENGRSSEASEAIMAATTLPMDWTYIYLTAGLLLVGGLGFAVWKIIRGRREPVYEAQHV
ncbi:MAG: fibronectin type III domain-containing protein, partial [Verrucomicrobiota bacterium]